MFLVRSHLYVPEKMFTEKMRSDLTMINPAYEKAVAMDLPVKNIAPVYYLYRMIVDNKGNNVYQIPRFYNDYIYTKNISFDTSVASNTVKFIPPKDFILNSEQLATIESAEQMILSKYGAVIVAKTGEGKTTMAIKMICDLGLKTLILVHKDTLIKQWRENLLMLTDLKDNDIGILQQGKFKDGKVVIGSQASLMRDTIGSEINRLFGFVIQDEVHRIGAKMFLRAFTRFNSMYRLGLSATPNREDKLEKLYFLHISNNLIQHNGVRNVNSNYTVIEHIRTAPWRMYPAYLPYKFQVINNIVFDMDRNKLLADIIIKTVNESRRILVLSERIKHLKDITELTKSLLIDKGLNKKIVRFYGAETINKKQKKEGVIREKIIDPSKDELISADIIFATYSKAKEGVDIPPLDTLLFATPLSSELTVVQAKGRIEREYGNKQYPLVIDMYDSNIKLCRLMFDKRERIYAKYLMKRIK